MQLHVFPVREGSKAPAIKDWANRARSLRDWQMNEEQWRLHERWGAPCGPLNLFWVLDVDPRHGGLESLAALEARYGELPITYIVRTPSGGWHYYFRWQDICALLTNTAGKLGPGLDIRAEGGMVLVPPTAGYTPVSTGGAEPVDAPAWLLALLLPAPKQQASAGSSTDGEAPIRRPRDHFGRALQAAIDEIKQAPAGSRDATMNRNAYGIGRLIGPAGQPRDSVVEVLVDTAIAAGYDPAKALDCCNRAVDAGMQNPREVAASPSPAVAVGPVRHNGQPAIDYTGPTGDLLIPPEVTALRSCPPKPGAAPVDLTSEAGRRWTEKDNEYRAWQRDLRDALRPRLVVVQYDQSRVLYERVGLRRVHLLANPDVQAGHIVGICERAGFRVGHKMASELAEEFLKLAPEHVSAVCPTLWDDGEHLYFYESPKVEAGPTPTWDTLLARMSDPDAFLAHAWSAFDYRFRGRQVLWLQGEGNDGKTIAFDALFEGAGTPYAPCIDTDLVNGNQFFVSNVWNKPAVVVGDSKSANIIMSGMMHRLTGRDNLGVEYKFASRFSAKFQGVVFVTSNTKPQIEKTRSNMTRLTVVTIHPGAWVDDLPQKLRAEVPALLARAREAYARLCPDNFTIEMSDHSRSLLAEATAAEDETHASMLFQMGFRIEGDDFIPRSAIVSRTKVEGYKLISFYRWLEAQPGVRAVKMHGARGFRGLK